MIIVMRWVWDSSFVDTKQRVSKYVLSLDDNTRSSLLLASYARDRFETFIRWSVDHEIGATYNFDKQYHI